VPKRTVYTYQMDPAPGQHLGQGRARRARTRLELVGLLAHALPVSRIGSRPGGDAPPAGEELIQRRQVDDGHMGDRFELGIERGDVGGGQRRAYRDFRPPTSVTNDVVEANRLIVRAARGLGYRSTCRWWILHAAKYLAPYEYYMRIDDDSFIEDILDYDPFMVMRAAGVDYAANLVRRPDCLTIEPQGSSRAVLLGRGVRPSLTSNTKHLISPSSGIFADGMASFG
jgi:hypothetical protein